MKIKFSIQRNCNTLNFFFFFFIRPTDPTFRVEGDGKRNILLGWPKQARTARETIANMYFLAPFIVPSTVWKYQEIRTILEQLEAEIAKRLRTAQPQPKVTGSYKKKRVFKNEKLARNDR